MVTSCQLSSRRPSPGRRCTRFSLVVVLLGAIALLFGVDVDTRRALACGGDPPPPRCGKSLVFTVAVPGVVKRDPEKPVVIEVKTVTFLNILEIPPGSGVCPKPPYEATVELSLDCGQLPGARNTVSFELALGYNIKPVRLVIPPGPPRKCRLDAKITVVFSDDMVISQTATPKCICIVDCSDKDPSLPRLELRPVIGNSEVARVHPGGQTAHRYRICNWDSTEIFRGRLHVVSENESRRPVDESPTPAAPGTGVFAISDPESGDDFPIAFADQLDGGCIILPPEPQRTVRPELNREIILGPCEWVEVDVITRPWGMCANGSCGSLSLVLDGRFSDRTDGIACASAVVAVDTSARPSFSWPDSGAVTTVNPDRDAFILDSRLFETPFPVMPVRVGVENVRISNGGKPVPSEESHSALPLTSPMISELPERGRDDNENFFLKPVDFVGPFSILFDISAANAQGKPIPTWRSFSFVPDAPHGFADVGPIAMGEIAAVDSFFDVFYQVSGEARVLDPRTGETKSVPLRIVERAAAPSETDLGKVLIGLLVELGTEVAPRDVVAGAGAGGVVQDGVIVGIDLHHDFGGFVRPGTSPTCPQPEVVDLRCATTPNGVTLYWNTLPRQCDCEKIEIRDATGAVIMTLPGNTTSVSIPCERLPAPSGTLCVVCIGPDGRETRACCDYSCDGCLPIDIARCSVDANGKLVVVWNSPRDGCCERIVVRETRTDTILRVLPGTATGVAIDCSELPVLTGEICIECVDSNGQVVSSACCRFACPPRQCPPLANLTCRPVSPDQGGPAVIVSWDPVDPLCCTRIRIVDANGNVLVVLPPTATSAIIPCDQLSGLSGTLCVQCVRVDPVNGALEVVSEQCCEYTCPVECPPLEIVKCEPLDDPDLGPAIAVGWNPIPAGCCDQLRVFVNGNPVAALPPDATSVVIPCSDNLPDAGQICIRCFKDGEVVDEACCQYRCPPPECPPIAVNCDPTADSVVVTWTPPPARCCPLVRIRDGRNGPVILEVPADAGFVEIPCEKLSGAGVLCVECVDEAGNVTSIACCEYECPCPPIDVVCDPTGDAVVLAWTPRPARCCEKVVVRFGVNGPIIAEVPASVGSITIPCDELPARAGTLCVECVDPSGAVTSRDCCDYSCEPCPRPELLRCDTVDGKVLLLWSPLPQNCCRRIEIVHRPTGTVVATLPGTETMFAIDCSALPTPTGELCVVCVDPDGNRDPNPPCCDYRCEPDCPPLEVACDPTGDPTGDSVIVVWNRRPRECCEKVRIRAGENGPVIREVPADLGEIDIPCAELPERVGRICVECVDPAGNVTAVACCEYDCRPSGGGQRPFDCNQDGAVDIGDSVCLLSHLFLGRPRDLPCDMPGELLLMDWNGSGEIDLSDAIASLRHLFLGGPRHVLGEIEECVILEGCPSLCRP